MLFNTFDLKTRAQLYYNKMSSRRSCRHFTSHQLDIETIKTCILTAGTAPSGANKQPWFFSVVQSPQIKKEIRLQAEKEEFDFYNTKATRYFLDDLKQFKTSWQKPHLEDASVLIVIFYKNYEIINKKNHIPIMPKSQLVSRLAF